MNVPEILLQKARSYAQAMARERRILETQSSSDRETGDHVVASAVDTLEFLEALADSAVVDAASAEALANLISASRQRLQLAGVILDGAQGEPFDTKKHLAVKEVAAGPTSHNQVSSVISYGITCNGERIRPARVVVALRGKE